MRIERLEYEDKNSDWKLPSLDFFPDLTLLVGASGVGKTRILKAIQTVKRISLGDKSASWRMARLFGVRWDISFSIAGQRYRWEGEYSGKDPSVTDLSDGEEEIMWLDEEDLESAPKPTVLYERLFPL